MTHQVIAKKLRGFYSYIYDMNITPDLGIIDLYFKNENDRIKLIAELYTFYYHNPKTKTVVSKRKLLKTMNMVAFKLSSYKKRKNTLCY